MPTWLATLLVGAGTMLVNGLLTAYYYGKLTQKVSQNSEDITELKDSRREQWQEINLLGRSVEKVKGKIGMNGI